MAKPGDVCVLLAPAGDDDVAVRSRQQQLRKRFGGRIHEPVHLTCQRFCVEDGRPLVGVVRPLARELRAARPFPVMADSVVAVEHPFWESRLLRWRIRSTLELKNFGQRLERLLASAGLWPHFPYQRGWLPRYVTALEDIRAENAGGHGEVFSFPCRLFDAQRLVFSVIEARRRFRVLLEVGLTGD